MLEWLLKEMAGIFIVHLVKEKLHQFLELDLLDSFDIILIVDVLDLVDSWCEFQVDECFDSW